MQKNIINLIYKRRRNVQIIGSGVVFKAEENTIRQSNAFPDICILPSGRYLASCRAAPTKAGTKGQHVLLSFSDDKGVSWSEPYSPFHPQMVGPKYGLFRSAYLTSLGGSKVLAALCWVDHSNPELPFFNPETGGLLDSKVLFSFSEDDGENWSEPQLMDTYPFDIPVPLTGPILILKNGDLACQFELNKHYYDTNLWQHASVFMFSKNMGKTWEEYVYTARDPLNKIFYWDQRPGVLEDGKILNFFWTYNYKKSRYLNIHTRESIDNGRTWSDIWDTGVPGQPARPVSIGNGRIALVYVDRSGTPTIKIRFSSDYGKTFDEKTEYIIYQSEVTKMSEERKSMQDTWAEMEKFSIGLPVTAILPNRDILVLFYAGHEPDITDVRWVRIKGGL